MEIKCADCKNEFQYSKEDVKKHYLKLSIHNIHDKNEMDFVVCPRCQYENYIEEKMLLNKCGICGGFLYEHTDLETANRYIYCPKCKEEADKVKARMTDEMKQKFDIDYKKKILTDIRDYLVKKQEIYKPQLCHMDRLMFFVYAEQLYDLTEYAEKLGVEL